eukprot:TRINITY_DN447_c0_g1_i1.p1 TRINITY_DN447_c0_g1~~TRINITY_DN447_c0_g1_i1.p1  ORF type:complete len:314 (+),score=75.82 TRINITY_DN447_c0_g1_i1:78-944(+)
MAPGDDFMKQLWQGKIPVEFSLGDESVCGFPHERPSPIHALLPRMSYLGLSLGDIKTHFSPPQAAQDLDVWLSRDSAAGPEPVPWHLPVGVLFDWYQLRGRCEAMPMLPLRLRVHFGNFPGDGTVRIGGVDKARALFEEALQRSLLIRFGTADRYRRTRLGTFEDLQDAIKEGNYPKFAAVRAVLHKQDEPKELPVMVHIDDAHSERRPLACAPEVTLGHFLRETLPDVYGDDVSIDDCSKALAPPSHRARLLIHGVTPVLSTPLQWLVEYMCHPDGFLHIVVRRNRC